MPTLLEPLRHPTFLRFFAGQALSYLGDFAFLVALPWQVILLGASTATLGGILGSYSGAQLLFLLWGGVVVDRLPRRVIVVASDVAQGGIVAILSVLASTGLLGVWHLYVTGALMGVAQAFATPALNAFLPETVPPGTLQDANSLYQGTRMGMGIVGPALGAVLITLGGTPGAFAFDAATFGLSAVLLATAPSGPWRRRGTSSIRPGALGQVRKGLRYARRVPWLWITLLLFAAVNAAEAGPRNVVLPVFVAVELKGGAGAIGTVLSAELAGALLGYILPSLLPRPRKRGSLAYGATALLGAAVLALGLAVSLTEVILLSVVRGLAFGIFGLMWETSLMEYIDEGYRGRIFSLDMLGSFAFLPISMAASGILADVIGASRVFLLGGLAVLVCAAVGLLYPPARTFQSAPYPSPGP